MAQKVLIKRDSSWRKIYEVLAARMRKLITARARKYKRSARMLANARKDHSIPFNCVDQLCLHIFLYSGHIQSFIYSVALSQSKFILRAHNSTGSAPSKLDSLLEFEILKVNCQD